jgi:hypothetical protein
VVNYLSSGRKLEELILKGFIYEWMSLLKLVAHDVILLAQVELAVGNDRVGP